MEDKPNTPEQPGDGTPQAQPGNTTPAPEPAKDGKIDAKAGAPASPAGPPAGGPAGNNDGPPTVPPEPPLSVNEKVLAGTLIILAMLLAFLVIIIHWPDKTPTAENTTYRYKPFHMTLIAVPKATSEPSPEQKNAADKLAKDESAATNAAVAKAEADKAVATDKAAGKPVDNTAADKAAANKAAADQLVIADRAAITSLPVKPAADNKNVTVNTVLPPCGTIQFGALILILVAAAGFMGNLVYVSTSFTAFVGAEKFKRSWIMWYVVKPFSASGLAMFLYLGLNSTTITPPVNLNGIIAAAALAGLFTDIATQKLKEIFTAAFKPTDNRPDKLTDGNQTVDLANMHPEKIDVNQQNNFLIPGQNLDPKNIMISINGTKIVPATITITPTLIKFPYTVSDKTLTKFTLLIMDAKNVKIDGKDLGVV